MAQLLSPRTPALAREAAQKSIVLLKNKDALLPLSKKHTNSSWWAPWRMMLCPSLARCVNYRGVEHAVIVS
jgi:beta-glucosidase-like glycosyl hydrolase